MVSGLSTISSSLEIAELVLLVNNWKAHPTLGNEINQFFTEIEMIKNQSIISFEFNRESDLNSFVKVVSFKNKFVSEGILRYLLDKEDQAVISPILQVEENFLEYIREVNRITDDLYSYMIQEVYINKDVIVVDENSQIIKLEGRFNLIDLKSSTILQTQNISSEFIDRNSDEDLAYLDFGLKVGEIIYNIKF